MDAYEKALRELKEAVERVARDPKKRRKAREMPLPKIYKIVSRGPEYWER